MNLNNLHIISFSHKMLGTGDLGLLQLTEPGDLLKAYIRKFGLQEAMYLGTCNRSEFILISKEPVDKIFVKDTLEYFYDFDEKTKQKFVNGCCLISGLSALRHLFRLASSLESMVIGEREILGQMKAAYEHCKKYGVTGWHIQVLMQKTIETAKRVLTKTAIADKPVSVVSLAFRHLRAKEIPKNSRFLIIGEGETARLFGKYLKKTGFRNFSVFSRTIEKAEFLANELGGQAYELNDLDNYSKGFDVIISSTSSKELIITESRYRALLSNDTSRKFIADLAVPCDLDPLIADNFDVDVINLPSLKKAANKNKLQRKSQIIKAEEIVECKLEEMQNEIRMKEFETAFQEVIETTKLIRSEALQKVFSKELAPLDNKTRELLEKVTMYIERKYISTPLVKARKILLEQNHKS